MSTAILTDYDNLFINDGNTDFAIAPATPHPHGSTKIKRWWGSGYESTTYASCAVIEIADSFIIVDCDKAVRLKMIKGESSLSFSVGFDKPGDGNINRILVCPKTDLHALVNYDDYYYDYGSKQIVHTQFGTGGIVLQTTDITYTIQIDEGVSFTLRSAGTVDYTVNWGDGSSPENSTSNSLSHTYASAGTYVVKINSNSGASYQPRFDNSGDEDQIISVAIGFIDSTGFGNDLSRAFRGAQNMTQYTQVAAATSSVTTLRKAFQTCSSLTSFPVIDTSSVTIFLDAWKDCSSLTSFPSLDYSNATEVHYAWQNCSSLADFPANQFNTTGTLASYAFTHSWTNCALTAQSIENILTSLDTNGASNITLGISGGTNAAKTTWSTAANTAYNNLVSKGWTITFNS